ncbi:MAG TPA: SelT/SelW/SelH family protein [Deltaproteobacteria bacterium]|nr:SelT/SelW/SelH family protein [Deltaproteobacteria bacterium]
MPRAASLAEKLREEVGVETKLIKSSGGVFEVKHNGKLIFSKKKTGRFPDPAKIVELIKNST